jgi:hypothetical protein
VTDDKSSEPARRIQPDRKRKKAGIEATKEIKEDEANKWLSCTGVVREDSKVYRKVMDLRTVSTATPRQVQSIKPNSTQATGAGEWTKLTASLTEWV